MRDRYCFAREDRPCNNNGYSLIRILDVGTAYVEPAISALPDEIEWTTIATIAHPLNQGIIRLDYVKRVYAMGGSECHFGYCVGGLRCMLKSALCVEKCVVC